MGLAGDRLDNGAILFWQACALTKWPKIKTGTKSNITASYSHTDRLLDLYQRPLQLSCLLPGLMCSAPRLILHLARNIISCPLHISTLLLYLEGSKKTLDLTPCLPNRPKGVALHSGSMGGTPPGSSVASILDCLRSSPTLPCFWGVVFSRWLQSTWP